MLRQINLLLLFGVLCPCILSAQTDPKTLRKEASSLIEKGQFSIAVAMLESYQSRHTEDLSILPLLAEAQWGAHEAFKAAQSWNAWLSSLKEPDPLIVRSLAMAWHHSGHFKEAISNYKRYLSLDSKAEDKLYILGSIQRAANGLSLQFSAQQMLIENPGAVINSAEEDFKPIPSQIVKGRFYFSSNRLVPMEPLGAESEIVAEQVTVPNCNIYQSQNDRGVWVQANALKSPINTSKEEVLLDFKNQGSILYFLSGNDILHSKIRTDTFRSKAVVKKLEPQVMELPYLPEAGDRDFIWINDNTFCFASKRLPGYGSYDLFICQLKDGNWSEPFNIGPSINTNYDEVCPYLTLNGNTLYFSSNSQASIGGYDIFSSTYAQETQSWSAVENLGLPINSAGDDLWFRLGLDSQEAYLSSDRRDQGIGNSDIYLVYFKKPTDQQNTPNLSYAWIDPLMQGPVPVNSEITLTKPKSKAETMGKSSWVIDPIYLPGGDFVLSELMKTKFQQLSEIYRKDPSLKFVINSFVSEDASGELDLLFAIRNAEKAAEYLTKLGLPVGSIAMSSFGANYPIAIPEIAGVPNQTSAYFNNRLEVLVIPTDTTSISFTYNLPDVGESLSDREGSAFREKSKGLNFRVQFLVSGQMYKGEIFNNAQYRDPYVEATPGSGTYRFMVGFEKRYQNIQSVLNRLRAQNYSDSFIVAYLDGRRLAPNEISPELLRLYPDLQSWKDN